MKIIVSNSHLPTKSHAFGSNAIIMAHIRRSYSMLAPPSFLGARKSPFAGKILDLTFPSFEKDSDDLLERNLTIFD